MTRTRNPKCQRLPVTATKAELVAAHKAKMADARKAGLGRKTGRAPIRGTPLSGYPASINRHTGKPHEHKREIARRGVS